MQGASGVSRDLSLYGLTVGSVADNLVKPVRTGGEALQGPMGPADFLTRLGAAKDREISFKDQMKQAQVELRRVGLETFSCADMTSGKAGQVLAELVNSGGLNPNLAITAKGGLSAAKSLCENNLSDSAAVRDLVKQENAAWAVKVPRLIGEMQALYVAEDTFAEKNGTARGGDRNAYRVALLEYQRVLDAPDRNEPTAAAPAAAASAAASAASAALGTASTPASDTAAKPKTKLDAAFENLRASIAKLKSFDDKVSLKLLSEERYDAIGETLTALTNPKAADDATATDKDRAGRALRRLAETYENWKAVEASAQEVRMRPLLMQQSLDKLQGEALGRAIALDEVKLQLQHDRVSLLERQATHFRNAHLLLGQGVSLPEASLAETLKPSKVSAAERTRIVQAAGHYGYAIGDLESQIQVKRLQASALQQEHSLALSENSIRQWNILIGGNVDLLTAWTETGVKEETISRYVNTLLLFALLWKAY